MNPAPIPNNPPTPCMMPKSRPRRSAGMVVPSRSTHGTMEKPSESQKTASAIMIAATAGVPVTPASSANAGHSRMRRPGAAASR